MSKVAVVYWSSTGNTEAMANAVADGIREKGGEAVLHTCEDFDGSKVAEYDAIAFGCPAMGDEVLEDTEFEPMFDGCKDALKVCFIPLCNLLCPPCLYLFSVCRAPDCNVYYITIFCHCRYCTEHCSCRHCECQNYAHSFFHVSFLLIKCIGC